MINRIILTGRLTRDPEVRNTTTGKIVANFAIAVDRRIKSGDQTADFFNISVWGQSAEFAQNYLKKGRLVGIDGRLQTRKYTDANGNNREAVEVVADNVSLLDRPRDDGYAPSESGAPQPAAAGAKANLEPADDEYDPFADS